MARSYGTGNYRWIDSHHEADASTTQVAYRNCVDLSDLSLAWITCMAMGGFALDDSSIPEQMPGLQSIYKHRLECVNKLPPWKGLHPTATCFSTIPSKEQAMKGTVEERSLDLRFFGHQLGAAVAISVDPSDIAGPKYGSGVVFRLRSDRQDGIVVLEYNYRVQEIQSKPFEQVDGWKETYRWSFEEFIITYHFGLALLVSHSVSMSYRYQSPLALPASRIDALIKWAADPMSLDGYDAQKLVPVTKATFQASNGQMGRLEINSLHPGCVFDLTFQEFGLLEVDQLGNRLILSNRQINFRTQESKRAYKVLLHFSLVGGNLHILISPPQIRDFSQALILRTKKEIESWQDDTLLPIPWIKLRLQLAPLLTAGLTRSLRRLILSPSASEWDVSTKIKVSEIAEIADAKLSESYLDDRTLEHLSKLLMESTVQVRVRALKMLLIRAEQESKLLEKVRIDSAEASTVVSLAPLSSPKEI